jgi:hypothetical protein
MTMRVFGFIKEIYHGLRISGLTLWSAIKDFKYSKSIILVYSMGKVGSSSVDVALRKRLPHVKIFHVHFLSDHWLKEILPGLNSFFHTNIELGNSVLNFISQNPRKRLKIVTLVREPFMREISDAFENWKGLFPDEKVIDHQFLSDWMDSHSHDYTLNWFDTEFKNFTGFDIYSRPFDKRRGYTIYNLENMDILCIKLERLNDTSQEAFRDFLNLKRLSISSKNSSSNKKEKELYRLLRSTYRPDIEKLDRVYRTKYVMHFYSEEEIAGLKR